MLLTEMALARDVKRRVEKIVCPMCRGGRLTFKSVAFSSGFVFKEGESMTVDAHCESCLSDPALNLEIKDDGDFG